MPEGKAASTQVHGHVIYVDEFVWVDLSYTVHIYVQCRCMYWYIFTLYIPVLHIRKGLYTVSFSGGMLMHILISFQFSGMND